MTLTPTLAVRNGKRSVMIASLKTNAKDLISGNHDAEMQRHDRLSSHTNPTFRAQRRAIHRKSQEIGHRFYTLKAKIEALDLSASAGWTAFQSLPDWPGRAPFDLTQPLSTAYTGWSHLPATPAGPSAELAEEWAFETTAHDIHDAFRGEVEALIGSDIHFLGTTIITLGQDKVDVLTMLRRRRDAMLALSTLPGDPYGPHLWGHDTRLRSLSMVPKVGNNVPFTPAFAAGTLAYTMDHRGDQVHRVDAVAEDPQATVTVTKEARRVVVRVEAENGIDTADYVIAGSANAKLASLAIKTGATPRALTPAFDAATLAYQSPAGIPLAALTVEASAAAPGATIATAWKPAKDNTATSIEITVTAPDGTTTAKTVITQASG